MPENSPTPLEESIEISEPKIDPITNTANNLSLPKMESPLNNLVISSLETIVRPTSMNGLLYQSLDAYGGGSDTFPKGIHEQREFTNKESGLKIFESQNTLDHPRDQNTADQSQNDLSVVLTKQPSGPVTVLINTPSTTSLKVLNSELKFTPSNWKVPQKIHLFGCAPAGASVTFTAKANNEGGFQGTESDSLTITLGGNASCGQAGATSTQEQKTAQDEKESYPTAISSEDAELNSPLFLILRIIFQPFILIYSAAKDWITIPHETPGLENIFTSDSELSASLTTKAQAINEEFQPLSLTSSSSWEQEYGSLVTPVSEGEARLDSASGGLHPPLSL